MLKSLVATIFTVALFCAASTTQLHAADPASAKTAKAKGDPKLGEQVFLKNCFACHSTAEGQKKVGPSLFHVSNGAHPRRTETEIRGYLQNGKQGDIGRMPSFATILTKEDTDNLLAYIHTL